VVQLQEAENQIITHYQEYNEGEKFKGPEEA
jgi:hypothetical protein